jgi:Putative MetA-pathway of phenol degradation
MMKSRNELTAQLVGISVTAIIMSFGSLAIAVDDGARTYWKQRDGTDVVSFQYLNLNMQASDSQQFDPGQYIYPNSDAEANIMIASWAHHMTLFNRASLFAVNVGGGSVGVDVDTSFIPSDFLPPGVTPGSTFSQSASGYIDPSVQLDVNLFGTSSLVGTADLLNYEPTWTIDAAVMLALPVGEYDGDKLVNMGLNRWWGRLALPIKYHFGVFAPGYMSSFELTPSVWIFAENDDFLGQSLENDPLLQLEAHLTQDFTRTFFGSLDLLYRSGFQSEINGVEVGEELDIGDVGFTLNFQASDNLFVRTTYSSNVFGDDKLNNSIIRLQLVYGWHRLTENMKKLKTGH